MSSFVSHQPERKWHPHSAATVTRPSPISLVWLIYHQTLPFFTFLLPSPYICRIEPFTIAKLAQSRPPPIRTHSALTTSTPPPPLSPRTLSEKHSEKRSSHGTRRKSARDTYVLSEKKPSRPATISRRTTPQYVTKVGAGYNNEKRPSKAEYRDREDDGVRDSGESFPQFWYVPHDDSLHGGAPNCVGCMPCT